MFHHFTTPLQMCLCYSEWIPINCSVAVLPHNDQRRWNKSHFEERYKIGISYQKIIYKTVKEKNIWRLKEKILWYHKVRPCFHGPTFTCVFYFVRIIFLVPIELNNSIPGGNSGKESACQFRRHKKHGFNPWVWKIPWRTALQPTPVFLPRESHGQRSLVG